jgi:hypothetical protein
MNTRKPQLLAGIVVITVTAGLYLLFGRGAGHDSTHDLTATTGSSLWKSYDDADGASPAARMDTSEYANVAPGSPTTANLQIYTDPLHGFSFKHPAGYTVSAFEESGGTMTLVTGPSADQTFQIFAQTFEEKGDLLTAERIKQDLPTMIIDNPATVVLGDGGHALIFLSGNDESRTREVWIADRGYLYQIKAPIAFDAGLARIMDTWRSQ